ncbi:sulfatase-like hydrolase/transferase [Shewanella canadensis]|nr:sulfatase-like hydrolase/transferase [Shewanella canadensis]
MQRTFWRTNALMLLSLILLYNFRQLLQYYSSFSIATAMIHVNQTHLLSQGLLIDLAQFGLLILLLHLIWSLIITLSCRPWFYLIRHEGIRTQIWLIISLSHFTLVFATNAYLFPTSLLGFLRDTPLASPLGLTVLGGLITTQFLWSLYHLIGRNATLGLVMVTLSISYISTSKVDETYDPIDKTSPNVFIIGIDALRPDHLGYRNRDNHFTPNIDKFLSEASIFDETYTPQARTYVAWMSLLSGQYPIKNGARFNLAPPELVQTEFPLIRELKQQGYMTTYAMDERRFNQIDEEYGFDQVVGPKIGAADAIITNIADIPLINLFIKLPLSEILFPYLYMNRAYGKAYDPILFNQTVSSSLSTNKPNFLAVHFCQLHWPYTSKDFIDMDSAKWKGNYNHFMYQALLSKVDEQFHHFMDELMNRGFLENAIVYLVSDHGEGFMLEQDTLANHNINDSSNLNVNAWGHGTNILSQEQSNVLMAYRKFPQGSPSKPQMVSGIFSLIDIAPSLFSELNLSLERSDKAFDGIVLPKERRSKITDITEREVFVESSRPVKSINASFIDDRKVLSETASKYEVRENGRIVMLPQLHNELIGEKQRSIYYKHWQLAMLPDYEELILVDTKMKTWSSITNYQGSAPWVKMLTRLCEHYRDDQGFDKTGQCQNAITESQSMQDNNITNLNREVPSHP